MNKWRIRKLLCAVVVSMLLLHGGIMPVQADKVQTDNAKFRSNWARLDLLAGYNYGVFPMNWFEQMLQPITEDQLQSMLQATARKLDTLGLRKQEKRVTSPIQGNVTREAVIQSLYTVFAQYEWPDIAVRNKEEAMAYWQQKGIVKGTELGLERQQLCTVEQAIALATRLVTDRYAALEKGGGKGFLWKVSHRNHTMYLFGSLHVGSMDCYPLHPKVKAAFDQSDELIVEGNITDEAEVARLQAQLVYRDGTVLKDHVSVKTYEKVKQACAKLNLPEEHMNTLIPWQLAQTLETLSSAPRTEQAGFTYVLGIDDYLLRLAKIKQKPIRQLEGLEFQGKLLSSFSADYQEKVLNQTLDRILTPLPKRDNRELGGRDLLLQQWAAGDVKGLTAAYSKLLQASGKEMTQAFFGERDKNMASKLMQLLEQEGQGNYFVVVGVGHLTFKGTMIEQLQRKGLTVQAIQY